MAAQERPLAGVSAAGWTAPALLLAGAAAILGFGAATAGVASEAAERDARSAFDVRLRSEVALAAERLRGIVADTRERGVFKDLPFALDVKSVAWTAAPPPAPDAEFGEAERLEFQEHDKNAALAEVRRVGAGATPTTQGRAWREEGRILTDLDLKAEAAAALRRAAGAPGASERDVLLARLALSRGEGVESRDSLRRDLVSGRFASVAPEERLVALRDLGGDAAETAPFDALVALRDAGDPDAVVVAGDGYVAWQIERDAVAVRVAVAPLGEFAKGLVPAARDGLATPRRGAAAAWPKPFPPLPFAPTPAASVSFDAAGAGAARSRLLPTFAVAAALVAGAVFTFLSASSKAELERRKDAFLCAVTHELKTPIANVLLYAETLKEHGASDPASIPKFSGTIAAEALRLEARVAEILEVASGRVGVPRGDERFDAAKVVREVVAECAERAAGRDVEFEAKNDVESAMVRGSPRMFRRALAAVVDNAFKFAPAGAIRIAANRADRRIVVVVEDEGPGVAEADRGRVFEPFVRLGDERTRDVPGTGLGLTLARQGVESCGGTIRCEGRVGSGARFVVEVPEA